jgi:hypothetical protein
MALAVGGVGLTVLPMPAAFAASSSSVTPDSQGWWNTTGSGLPANPLRGTAPVVKVPSPDVPEGLLPVSTRVGQPARIAAIGITFDAPRGTTTVNSLVMHLKESDAGGVQQGSGAAVRACPITSFLVPETNGEASNIPSEDCDTAHADGKRADDGSWTFDLTSIASAWVDPFGTIPPNGVRLDPVGDAPATFQVVFTGFEDATFDVDVSEGAATSDPFASGDTSSGSTSAGSSSRDGSFSAPSATLPDVSAAPRTPAANPRRSATASPIAASRHAGETFGNFPFGALLVLAGGLLLAILTSISIGAGGAARPEVVRRQGGVSRALSSRQPPSNPS